MTGDQRARLHQIIDRMNHGLGAVDDSDESMVGAAAEMHEANARLLEANAHMRAGLEYVMRVAAHNKRITAVLREANTAALSLLNEETADGDDH